MSSSLPTLDSMLHCYNYALAYINSLALLSESCQTTEEIKRKLQRAVPGISSHLPTVPPTSAFPVSLGDLPLHLFTGSIPSCLLRDIASVSVSFSSVINFPSLLDQYKVYKHTRMSWSSKCPYFTTPSLVDHSLLANNPFLAPFDRIQLLSFFLEAPPLCFWSPPLLNLHLSRPLMVTTLMMQWSFTSPHLKHQQQLIQMIFSCFQAFFFFPLGFWGNIPPKFSFPPPVSIPSHSLVDSSASPQPLNFGEPQTSPLQLLFSTWALALDNFIQFLWL